MQRASESQLEDHKTAFKKRITKCEAFHHHLAAKFHINTVLIYSNNPNTKAFEHCEWQLKGELTEGLVSDKDAVESWQQYTDQNHKLLFSKGEVKLMSTSELSAHQRKVAAWRKQIENTPYQSGYAATPLIPVTSRFRLAKETAKGDGTVHEGAGEYPKEVLPLEVEADKEHQEFYNCFKVREEMMETLTSWLPEIHKGFKG